MDVSVTLELTVNKLQEAVLLDFSIDDHLFTAPDGCNTHNHAVSCFNYISHTNCVYILRFRYKTMVGSTHTGLNLRPHNFYLELFLQFDACSRNQQITGPFFNFLNVVFTVNRLLKFMGESSPHRQPMMTSRCSPTAVSLSFSSSL